MHATRQTAPALLPVATAVLWVGCVIVGAMGFVLGYPSPPRVVKEPSPALAQLMHVELTAEAAPAPDAGTISPDPPHDLMPPALPEALAAPPELPLVAVASPQVLYPRQVEGPTRIVDAKQTAPHSDSPATQTTAPLAAAANPNAAKHLTFGQGEGRQPKPRYPPEAALARQQGTVLVRFTVGEDGRVRSADAATPCPYPLLNQAALRTVREEWRFPPGPVRSFEIPIEFTLKPKS